MKFSSYVVEEGNQAIRPTCDSDSHVLGSLMKGLMTLTESRNHTWRSKSVTGRASVCPGLVTFAQVHAIRARFETESSILEDT